MPVEIEGLYALLDLPHRGGLGAKEAAMALAAGGARVVQLRAKDLTTQERIECLREIAAPLTRRGVSLIVNDDLEAALAGVDGVAGIHLGQEDLGQGDLTESQPLRARLRDAGLCLGISTHTLAEVDAAMALGPDYIGFGPIFPTGSKLDVHPVVGLELLSSACGRARCPVVAIGGIDAGRARACMDGGAGAVAVISALAGRSCEAVEARTRALVLCIASPH